MPKLQWVQSSHRTWMTPLFGPHRGYAIHYMSAGRTGVGYHAAHFGQWINAEDEPFATLEDAQRACEEHATRTIARKGVATNA